MNPDDVTQGAIAPHLSADLYAQLQAANPGARVVVVTVPADPACRSPWETALIGTSIFCAAAGVAGLVFVVLSIISLASAMLPAIGGTAGVSITIKLARGKKGSK